MDAVGSGEDVSRAPEFLETQSGQADFGPVYFRSGSEPYMSIAIPGDGADAEVTVAQVNLKFMWDVVSQIVRVRNQVARGVHSIGTIGLTDFDLKKVDLSSLPQVVAARGNPESSGEEGSEASIAREVLVEGTS
jgi:hypothetical protein